MASYLDKAQVNTAITDNTKLDLGHQHITTANFMQLNVDYIREMVPGEKIDVKMETFARMNPLPVPTFGRASIRNRAYFVPFRTIFRGWDDFLTDNAHYASDGYQGSASTLTWVPRVTNSTLAACFTGSVVSSVTGPGMLYGTTDPNYDVTWNGGVTYNYTVKGRQAIKMLEALGYKIDWTKVNVTGATDPQFSALPLIAMAKIFTDWYFPQQYMNLTAFERLKFLTNYDVASGPIVLSAIDVREILLLCSYVCYDSDYFVSAWDTPNQPNAGNYSSDFKIVNIDTVSDYTWRPTTTNYGGTNGIDAGFVTNNSGSVSFSGPNIKVDAPFINPVINAIDSANTTRNFPVPISEYLLHGLHALTDFMKRNQLAGSRVFDRYLARFGKALPAEKLNRSHYLGAAVQNLQIGDIMSTADTSTGELGTFAGKGISYGNGQFDYTTDEFGYFIVLSSVVPATGYYQGVDRQVMRVGKTDFWQPEFDSLGVQPITANELYLPTAPEYATISGDAEDQIFGFTPRYADYKVAHDQLTGNFRLPSIQAGHLNAGDSWHLMRKFSSSTFMGDYRNCVHTPDFVYGYSDPYQYNRIFYYDADGDPDNITLIHNFEIASYVPMKALYDTYEFEDKGKKVTLQANGVLQN